MSSAVDAPAGYVVVAGAFLAHVACLGTLYTFTLYLLPIQTTFNVSLGAAALPGSLATAVMAGGALWAGAMHDHFRSRWVFLLGALLLSAGLWAASACESFALLLASFLLVGVGQCILAPGSIGVLQQWFDKRRGLASGLALAGSGGGHFIFAHAIADAMESDAGAEPWRGAMRKQAAFCLLCSVPAALMLRHRAEEEPEAAATEPGGASEPVAAAGVAKPTVDIPLRRILRMRAAQVVYASKLVGSFGYGNVFVYMAPFCVARGLEASETAWIVSCFGLSSMLGRVVLSALADRGDRVQVLQVSMALCAASALLWPFMEAPWQLAIFACFFGSFAGAFIAMPPPIMAESFSGVAGNRLSALAGGVFTPDVFGSLFGAPLAGLAVEACACSITGRYFSVASLTCGFFALHVLVLTRFPSPEDHKAECDALLLEFSTADVAGKLEEKKAERP